MLSSNVLSSPRFPSMIRLYRAASPSFEKFEGLFPRGELTSIWKEWRKRVYARRGWRPFAKNIYTRGPRKHERGSSSAFCIWRAAATGERVNSSPFRAQCLNYERDETALSNSWLFIIRCLLLNYSQICSRVVWSIWPTRNGKETRKGLKACSLGKYAQDRGHLFDPATIAILSTAPAAIERQPRYVASASA